MKSIRTFRTSRAALVAGAAATVALAALSLGAPAASASAGKAPTAKAAAFSHKAGQKASQKPVTCEGSTTKTVATALKSPRNHLLLTVTNTGSKPCYLYYYPALQFTDAQSVPPEIEASQPQAVVTLDPGQSGYAAAILSAADGSGKHGRTVKSLDVWFYGPSGTESVGKGAHPSLPAKGVRIDDSLTVTYWQQTKGDALSW